MSANDLFHIKSKSVTTTLSVESPLLYGFKQFNKQVQIVGAVFNFVASENHYSFLKQACEDAGEYL